jgi:molybdopterin-guanine dinucleotide biosynthesis protein B
MRIAAFVGTSGAGKTALLVALIRHFVTAGESVGAIKHTHHPLNDERRGDTAKFADAGADPVILAGDGQAILFSADSARHISYRIPSDLLDYFTTDIVLIEGFKTFGGWPKIEVDGSRPPSPSEAVAILEQIWRQSAI